MVVFRMHRTFFVFLKCTIQGGSKVDVLLIAFLHLWLKFFKGIDKYWIVPVRKLFYFDHCATVQLRCMLSYIKNRFYNIIVLDQFSVVNLLFSDKQSFFACVWKF